MSELRALIIDSAIEYATCASMVDELEAVIGWDDEHDIGLCRALELAHGEAVGALARLVGLVRVLMSQEAGDE